jgi:membrane protein implicated in regulation of membrane protease activity
VDLDRAWVSAAFGRDGHPGGLLHPFFGVGAIIVGILAGFNVAGPLWFQVIVFSSLSLFTFWLFRQRLLQLTRGDAPDQIDTLIGELDKTSEPWGIKVMRYEIKNITPPHDVLAAVDRRVPLPF